MFIYILNLLNDGLRKRKESNCERSTSEIINDTKYISQLAGIKKGLDFIEVNDRIDDIIKILSKYNLTGKDKLDILGKLVENKNNHWIFEKLNNSISLEGNLKFDISTVINNVKSFENCDDNILDIEIGDMAVHNNRFLSSCIINFKDEVSLKLINKKYDNPENNKNTPAGYSRIVRSIRGQEKLYDLTEKIRQTRCEKNKETRTICDGYYESCMADSEKSLIKITI